MGSTELPHCCVMRKKRAPSWSRLLDFSVLGVFRALVLDQPLGEVMLKAARNVTLAFNS